MNPLKLGPKNKASVLDTDELVEKYEFANMSFEQIRKIKSLQNPRTLYDNYGNIHEGATNTLDD